MKLSKEDIQKFATEDEKKILVESKQEIAIEKGIERLKQAGADFYGAEIPIKKVLQEIWNDGYETGYYRGTHNPDWGWPEEEEGE